MQWVYTSGSEKPAPVIPKASKPTHSGFFSSLLSSLSGGSTPQRTPTPVAPPPVVERDLLKVNATSVTLSVFAADVDVRLDKKISSELYRSTKKNPPSKLKYELIYVCIALARL